MAFVVLLVIASAFGGNDTPDVPDDVCLETSVCIASNRGWLSNATVKCAREIESMALYDYEWTRQGNQRFPIVKAQPPHFQDAAYAGQEIRFQNIYGVYEQMIYVCIYDPINDYIVDLAVDYAE